MLLSLSIFPIIAYIHHKEVSQRPYRYIIHHRIFILFIQSSLSKSWSWVQSSSVWFRYARDQDRSSRVMKSRFEPFLRRPTFSYVTPTRGWWEKRGYGVLPSRDANGLQHRMLNKWTRWPFKVTNHGISSWTWLWNHGGKFRTNLKVSNLKIRSYE